MLRNFPHKTEMDIITCYVPNQILPRMMAFYSFPIKIIWIWMESWSILKLITSKLWSCFWKINKTAIIHFWTHQNGLCFCSDGIIVPVFFSWTSKSDFRLDLGHPNLFESRFGLWLNITKYHNPNLDYIRKQSQVENVMNDTYMPVLVKLISLKTRPRINLDYPNLDYDDMKKIRSLY